MKSAGLSSLTAAIVGLLLSTAAGARAVEAKTAPAAASAASSAGDTAAATAATPDTPYATIVARNMFALVPIPPPAPVDPEPPKDPPPKITPNGIMTIFGKKEALYKVATKPKPGQPQKDDAYVLSEGEMQDDIEVVKIDVDNRTITFKNHGEVQELAVVEAAASGGGAPGSGGPGGGRMAPGGPPSMRPGGGFDRSAMMRGAALGPAARGGMGGGINSDLGNPQPNNGGMGGGGLQSPEAPQSQQSIEDRVMSAARQMALIEQNRLDTQGAVDQGLMPPLPPTMLTPPEATGAGGMPLVAQPEPVLAPRK